MEVLFLDDNSRTIESFVTDVRSMFGDGVHITAVSNLVDFDYELYESGRNYDRFVLDLGLAKPNDFPDEVYEEWLKERGISETTFLSNVISVPGWDYFECVMKKQESTKIRLNRVMLKTGYADLLLKEKGENCYLPACLLSKGDELYAEKLKAFFIG